MRYRTYAGSHVLDALQAHKGDSHGQIDWLKASERGGRSAPERRPPGTNESSARTSKTRSTRWLTSKTATGANRVPCVSAKEAAEVRTRSSTQGNGERSLHCGLTDTVTNWGAQLWKRKIMPAPHLLGHPKGVADCYDAVGEAVDAAAARHGSRCHS